MKVAFRFEVGTLRGVRESLPALLDLFDTYGFKASFLLCLGPDYSRPRVTRWFGSETLASQCPEQLRRIREAGHEVGVSAYDPLLWQQKAPHAERDWTRQQLQMAIDAYADLFGELPRLHAAFNFQVNPHLFELESEMGFTHASDTRGRSQYLPVLLERLGACPQLPVTLPEFSELLARPEVDDEHLNQFLFAETLRVMPHGEVMAISLDRDGERLSTIEQIMVMWKGAQGEFHTLGELLGLREGEPLRHQVGWDSGYPDGIARATQSLPLEQQPADGEADGRG